MRRPSLRLALAILGAAAILGGSAAFLFLRPLSIAVAVPEHDVAIDVYGLGTVEARVRSEIGFELSGTLRELHVDQGDVVQKGTVLARLDSREQEARVAQAGAAVAQALAAIEEAAADVERAEAVLAQAQRTNERKQALVHRGHISAQEAEWSQEAAEVAAAELRQACSRRGVAEANLGQAEATLRREAANLAQRTLTAPYDAVVVARHRELGTALQPGEPILTLVAPDTVWILAYVDEGLAGGLKVGQPAEIRLRSLPNRRFSGHVARIEIESDRVSEERRVNVACGDCPAAFHLGEQAEAVITTARLPEAVLVPQNAVHGFDGRTGWIWTVEDGMLQQRTVTFGERTLDGRLAIGGGLPEGAQAVTELRAGLRAGRAARAAESGAGDRAAGRGAQAAPMQSGTGP